MSVGINISNDLTVGSGGVYDMFQTKQLAPSNQINLSSIKSESEMTLTEDTDFTPIVGTYTIDGNSHYLKLQLNGFNATFSGFTFIETQLSTLDETANYVNIIMFWRNFGIYYYTIFRAYGDDITPPELSNFTIENAYPNRVYFDSTEIITGSTFTGFTITGKTIIGLTINAGQTTGHYFTVDSNFSEGDTPTIAYDGTDDIEDTASNALASFTSTSITNNITAIAVLTAPVLSLGAAGSDQYGLTWTDPDDSPNNEVNFEVQYEDVSSPGYISGITPAQDDVSGTQTGLTASTTYNFRIRKKGNGIDTADSSWSNVVQGSTTITAPTPIIDLDSAALATLPVAVPNMTFTNSWEIWIDATGSGTGIRGMWDIANNLGNSGFLQAATTLTTRMDGDTYTTAATFDNSQRIYAFRYDHTIKTLYIDIDGVNVESFVHSGTDMSGSNSTVNVGQTTATYPWQGTMNKFQMYNEFLSGTQLDYVKSLFGL